jgi:hypothetical protein
MPHPLVVKHLTTTLVKGPPAFEEAFLDDTAMLTPDGQVSWEAVPLKANFWMMADAGGGALDTLRNIALGITAVLFFFAGITYLYASFIIPVAAQELEKECKELNPALWEEYQAKLGEGETLATRPDLMQEMGMKLQPLLEAKLAEAEGKSNGVLPTALETTMNPMAKDPAVKKSEEENVLVVPLTTMDQWEDEKPKK